MTFTVLVSCRSMADREADKHTHLLTLRAELERHTMNTFGSSAKRFQAHHQRVHCNWKTGGLVYAVGESHRLGIGSMQTLNSATATI